MPINSEWRPDISSVIIGVVLGLAAAYLFYRLLPTLKRRLSRSQGWIQGRVNWMRSSAELRYQSDMVAHAEQRHLGRRWAALSQIYVPQRLLDPRPSVYDEAYFSNRLPYDFGRLWPELGSRMGLPALSTVNVEELLRDGRRTVVTGAAGSGKSVLLAHLSWRLATAQSGEADDSFADTFPALVHVAELQLTDEPQANGEPDVAAPLINAIQRRSGGLTTTGLGDSMRRHLADGNVYLLLDGYGELDALNGRAVLKWLRQLMTAFPETRILATAYDDGYGPFLHLGFTHTAVVPWRLGEVQHLVAKWGRILEIEETDWPPLEQVWRPGQSALETTLQVVTAMKRPPMTPESEDEAESAPPAVRQEEEDLRSASFALLGVRPVGENEDQLERFNFWRTLVMEAFQSGKAVVAGADIEALANRLATNDEDELNKGKATRLRDSLHSTSLFRSFAGGDVGCEISWWRDYLGAQYAAALPEQVDLAAHLYDPRWQGLLRQFSAQSDVNELAGKVLAESDPNLAREGLFQLGVWMERPGLEGWRREAMIRLGQLARRSETSQLIRLRALGAMMATDADGLLKFVERLLQRDEPVIRVVGTACLPMLADNSVVQLASNQLLDDDAGVRETAVCALAQMQLNPSTERPLVMALIADDEDLSLQAAEMLALNGGPGVVILKEALDDDDIQVRRAAVLGLVFVDEAWVEPLLTELVRYDNEWFVRSAANSVLEAKERRREPTTWRRPRAGDQSWYQQVAQAEGKRPPEGRQAIDYLTGLVQEADEPYVRRAAADLLAQLPAGTARPALAGALADDDALVRESALNAFQTLQRVYNIPL